MNARCMVVCVGFAWTLSGAAVAQQTAPPAPSGTTPRAPAAALPTAPADVVMTVHESQVIDRLHAVHVLEIAAGRLAATRGSTSDVKRYGEQLVKDHTRLDRALMAFAKRSALKLADVDQRKSGIDALEHARGREFDRVFLRFTARDQHTAIEQLRTAQPKAENVDISALLRDALPVLTQHEQRTLQLAAALS
jgi:putative membrane protein